VPADSRPDHPQRPDTARVFFALWPSPAIAQRLGEEARQAASRLGGRATRPETIHLTLAFLGNLPEARLPDLLAAAATVRASSFSLTIDHAGLWPRQRLLWAGVQAAEPLSALQGLVLEALAFAGFRPDGEPRMFRPHLTLVRRTRSDDESLRMADLTAIDAIVWHCRSFVLVRSCPEPSGSTYQVIEEFPLTD
jgi:RNA 2',3'-cyclic 3'-phosphodiesterase